MLKYLLLYMGGAALAYVLTPQVRALASYLKAFDIPNERKVHALPVPRMGGLAIFDAFHLTVFLGLAVLGLGAYPRPVLDRQWWTGFLPASAIIVCLGVVDDSRPLGARVKFLIQIAAALVAIRFGYVIDTIALPGAGSVELGLWGIPITLLWIVGLTNAFNLIDGLDGLASGVGFIASLTLGAVALLNQNVELALLCFALAGCLLGFLRYNSHPASIFLGDSGSLFLGFTLAVLSIKTSHKATAAVSILIPLLAFGLPIMDTLLAMLRRFLSATHVLEATSRGTYRIFFLRSRSMFEADRDHIHHRLMRLGITHGNCVIVLYAICLAAGAAALVLAAARDLNVGLVLVAMGAAAVFAIRKLRYRELELLRNGTLLPLARWPVLGYAPFQMLIDVGLVALAYYLAFWIRFEGQFQGGAKVCFLATLPVVLAAKMTVFYFTGLYRIKWQWAGLPDLLRGGRAMLLGGVAAAVVLAVLPVQHCSRAVLIMDFYIMSSLLLGVRFSLRLLEYYARANPEHKRKALIYGAGPTGSLLVRELLSNPDLCLTPVGFIDEHPSKQRKMLHGYPILGPSTTLAEQIRSTGATELIIANPDIALDQLNRIKDSCRNGGVTVRTFHMAIEAVPQS